MWNQDTQKKLLWSNSNMKDLFNLASSSIDYPINLFLIL